MRTITFNNFGEPANVLQLTEAPIPTPGPGEVRVRMLASPINPSDLLMIRGVYGKQPDFPASAGFEGVGIVEESGSGLLGKLLVGKRVAAMNARGGNWSEQVVIPAKQAIPMSRHLPLEQAAMFFVNPAAAFVMTRILLNVPRGDWLLQTAAGSALGRMVIRLGKLYGFHTLNVVRREEQAAELKALGGDAVITFDGDRDDPDQLREHVARLTDGKGVSYAIAPVGGKTASALVHSLGMNARLLLYGTLTDDDLSVSPRSMIGMGHHIEGFWLSRWMQEQNLIGKLKLVRRLTRLIRDGILTSEVGQTFPLEEITAAVQQAEERGRQGKTLLTISHP